MLASTVLILLASAIPLVTAQTDSIFTIQTIDNPPATSNGGNSCLPSITLPSDSGFMSVPQGETGSPTPGPSTSTSKGVTSGNTTPTTSGGATSSSTAPTSSQSTGAAAPGYVAGDGTYLFCVVALSGLSITLGFAWTLL